MFHYYNIFHFFFFFFFSDEKKNEEYIKLERELGALKDLGAAWKVQESNYEETITVQRQEKNEYYNKIKVLLANEEVCGDCFNIYLLYILDVTTESTRFFGKHQVDTY